MKRDAFQKWLMDAVGTDSDWKPIARYDEDGDYVLFLASPEDYYGKRLDGIVTVLLSEKTDELIGSKIKDVSKIVDRVGGMDVAIIDHKLRVDYIIIRHLDKMDMKEPIKRAYIQSLIKLAEKAEAKVELGQLCD